MMPEFHDARSKRSGRVGRYLLFESLGAGGMGEVHRARFYAAEGVVKELCVKRIRAELLEKRGAVERFIREARLSMSLTHGNIVSVFDFGRAGDEYYLAMEWVDGADLRRILEGLTEQERALQPFVAAHIVGEVARALAYAHELGGPDRESIVHRDIKPANVLIGRSGEVKISDFGVAAVAGDDRDRSAVGTKSFMAPEQDRGETPDPRVDLYALGLVLSTALGSSNDAPSLGESTAPELTELIQRLLADDPNERPSSARHVANELEEFVSRARADGAGSPRDILAELADATAERGNRVEQELDTDLSFILDGETDAFDAAMSRAATASSTLDESSPSAASTEGSPTRGSRAWLVIGLLSLIAALAIGGVIAAGEDDGRAAQASQHHAAPAKVDLAHASPTQSAKSPPPPTRPEPSATDAGPAEDDATASSPPPRPADAGRRARAPLRSSPQDTRPAARNPALRQTQRRPTEERSQTPGRLNINAVPWAEVFIDGRRAGVTPLFGLELPPGIYTIQFVNEPLGVDRSRSVTLSENEERDIVVRLN